jgi:hypothetical protein
MATFVAIISVIHVEDFTPVPVLVEESVEAEGVALILVIMLPVAAEFAIHVVTL